MRPAAFVPVTPSSQPSPLGSLAQSKHLPGKSNSTLCRTCHGRNVDKLPATQHQSIYYIHTVAINIIQIPVSHVCVYIYIHMYICTLLCVYVYIYIITYPISAYLCNWICVPLPAKRWAAWQLMSPGHGDPESSGLAMVS